MTYQLFLNPFTAHIWFCITLLSLPKYHTGPSHGPSLPNSLPIALIVLGYMNQEKEKFKNSRIQQLVQQAPSHESEIWQLKAARRAPPGRPPLGGRCCAPIGSEALGSPDPSTLRLNCHSLVTGLEVCLKAKRSPLPLIYIAGSWHSVLRSIPKHFCSHTVPSAPASDWPNDTAWPLPRLCWVTPMHGWKLSLLAPPCHCCHGDSLFATLWPKHPRSVSDINLEVN